MKKEPGRFRYQTDGVWLKGNTHIHSTASDGGTPVVEIAAMYAGAGYDFLFRTDHWVNSDVAQEKREAPLMWLDGIELDGRDEAGMVYHVVGLGRVEGITREMGLAAATAAAKAQGALLVLAHPHWCGNTSADALRWPVDGVEIYNHVCHWMNGKGNGLVHWSSLLGRNPATLGFAADDAHLRPEHPGWNGGWIRVNVATRSPEAILDAIRAGNFHSSCGPSFEKIELADGTLRLKTSPVQFVRLVGSSWCSRPKGDFGGATMTEVEVPLPDDWDYIYVEIEDAQGRRAWTNTLFV